MSRFIPVDDIITNQGIGHVRGQHADINRGGVVSHTDTTLRSVLYVVVGDHSGYGASQHLRNITVCEDFIRRILRDLLQSIENYASM